jgi:hypothetical protein
LCPNPSVEKLGLTLRSSQQNSVHLYVVPKSNKKSCLCGDDSAVLNFADWCKEKGADLDV